MGEGSSRIERHIQQERRDCRDNMTELKHRMARSVDWRVHCNERPLTMMGLAFGGGVLLSALIGGTRRPTRPEGPPQVEQRDGVWDILKVALTGIAVARLTSVVEDLLPGFRDEYSKAEAGRNSR